MISIVTPFTQALAFPLILGSGQILLGAMLVALSLLRSWRRISALVGAIWLVAGLCFVLFPGGVEALPTSHKDTNGEPRLLKIVTFNAASRLDGAALSQIMAEFDPDIIVLPEASDVDVAAAQREAGFDGELHATPDRGLPPTYTGAIAPTSVLVHSRLGSARLVDGPVTSFGTVALQFDDQRLPTVVGLHTAPPLPRMMKQWGKDLDEISQFIGRFEGSLVVAGDFNATSRHSSLAGLSNKVRWTAHQCSQFPAGTWPTSWPGILRAQIDHVLITHDLRAQDCTTMDVGESDHAAYVTTVVVPR